MFLASWNCVLLFGWVSPHIGSSYVAWQSMSGLWVGTLFVLAISLELWWTGALCRECDNNGFDGTKDLSQETSDKHCGFHGWQKYCNRTSAHSLALFSSWCPGLSSGDHCVSLCGDDTHPFPVKMISTQHSSGWLSQHRSKYNFLKIRLLELWLT